MSFQKKKITLIISSMRSGGAERVMANLANYWAEKGHEVSLIVFTDEKEKPFYTLNQNIKLFSLDRLNTHITNIMGCIFDIRKTLKKIKPDVVLSFLESVNMVSILAHLGLSIPLIISERTDPKYHRSAKLYKWGRLNLYPLASKLIVQTKSVYDFFPKKFQKFMDIIPNAAKPMPVLKKEQRTKIETIITVGRLTAEKNHKTLIEAFKKYVQHNPIAKLIIYGEGKERSSLQNLIDQLALSQKVTLFGTTEKVFQALREADLFVFPSLYEGFPNALCEAMSVGLPVIASKVSGNQDVLEDGQNGLMFDPLNAEALFQKMKIAEDQNIRHALSSKAREITQKYSEEKIYPLWDKMIEDVVTKRVR